MLGEGRAHMNKKSFFISLFVTCFTASVMAETFPVDGLMQPNKTYDEAATYDNMGVYEGTVDAVAQYAEIAYSVRARQYLPKGSVNLTDCESGYYCPGLQEEVNFNSERDQGREECPTGYGNSAGGAIVEEQCYATCNLQNANLDHATNVSGNKYYGADSIATCSATSCENGWTSTPDPVVAEIIGNDIGTVMAAVSYSGVSFGSLATFGLTASDKNAFGVNYAGKGQVIGHARCSSIAGSTDNDTWNNPTIFEGLVDETGEVTAQHCYCRLESFTPTDGTQKGIVVPWVYAGDLVTGTACSAQCAQSCAMGADYDTPFRTALLGAQIARSTCVANVISINWIDAPSGSVDAANATCTYGGDIKSPYAEPVAPIGKQFLGWKFKAKD